MYEKRKIERERKKKQTKILNMLIQQFTIIDKYIFN